MQRLRFKADDGSPFPDWKEKKIVDIFFRVKDKNKDGQNQNIITNSAEFGLINQRDFFDKDIAVDGKTENYTVIKTGDFVYNPRKSKQAPYGPFNCYQLEEDGIVSPLYTCLRPKGNADDEYLHWYFQSGSWYRFIYENGAQNGARHDRVGMTDSLMQEIPVYLPRAVEEQQKIAVFLSTIDIVIGKQKETVYAWEERKKGVMQKLFSQEVRFKDDDGSEFPDWEEKKLGDCCSLITKGTTPKEYPENGDVNFVRIDCIENGSINISKCLKINEQIHNGELARSVLKENDLLCSIAGALGVVTVVNKDILPANTNQALAILRLYESENVQYISKTLSSYIMKKYIRECKTVGAQPNLSLGQMRDLIIPYPCSEEQQKIADCLSSLDEVIEKQKATLAAWEEMKKGLLQQMFV